MRTWRRDEHTWDGSGGLQAESDSAWIEASDLEAILPAASGGLYPLIEAGKLACPPEDTGGIYRYLDFLDAIDDPSHPEHEELMEWIGGSFDPESFDVGRANLAIHEGWSRRQE